RVVMTTPPPGLTLAAFTCPQGGSHFPYQGTEAVTEVDASTTPPPCPSMAGPAARRKASPGAPSPTLHPVKNTLPGVAINIRHTVASWPTLLASRQSAPENH